MTVRPVARRRSRGVAALVACCIAAAALSPGATRGQADGAAAQGPVVPPVPEGTPAELLRFIDGLWRPATQPRSPEETAAYLRAAAIAAVQAADKILAQVGPADAEFAAAARRKLASLQSLVSMGDELAPRLLAAHVATLARSGDRELARDARLAAFSTEAEGMFASGVLDAGPAILGRLVAEVAANPDDETVARAALEFAIECEQAPGGGPLAQQVYATLGPLLARSGQPRVRRLGDIFAGATRRLALPGRPMEIRGTLLDGTPFDAQSLAGKVVLVDFWATWCAACLAEMPAIRRHYDEYHARGFEVVAVSLDDDRDAVERVVERAGMPWPVLFDASGEGGGHPLATHYGVALIPRMILIGRDGNVISIDAVGEKLGAELAKAFQDAE